MSNFDYWNSVYSSSSQLNLYPWSNIVSFFFRYKSQFNLSNRHVVELGCGSGSNLHVFADNGFTCTGVDISADAINFAKIHFPSSLTPNLFSCDLLDIPRLDYIFSSLPSISLIIDHASLTCLEYSSIVMCISTLKKYCSTDTLFFFNPYSVYHSSSPSKYPTYSEPIPNSPLADVPKIMFFDQKLIYQLSSDIGGNLLSLSLVSNENLFDSRNSVSMISNYEAVYKI